MSEQTPSVAQALREAGEHLSDTSDTARLDAELLMAHALGVTRSDMLLRHMTSPPPGEFAALVARRATSEPVAHIIGSQEFYGRTFAVTPDTLIPRGDSEILIDAAIAIAPDAKRVLDLGTGSGALLVTVLLELEGATGIATDASGRALDVAERNARALGLAEQSARFMLRDWTRPGWTDGLGSFDLVLCNPPYVEIDAVLDPDVRDFEPSSALFAGPDGLDDYRILLPQLRKIMNSGATAIFEIGHEQGDSVVQIAQNQGFSAEIRLDLAKRPRAVVLR